MDLGLRELGPGAGAGLAPTSQPDWDALLVRPLPSRLLLAAGLLTIATGVDVPWLAAAPRPLIAIRAAMVALALAAAGLGARIRRREAAEALVVATALGEIGLMALSGHLQGTTFTAYVAGFYQMLCFVMIFLPLRPPVFTGLVLAAGALWFGLFPAALAAEFDERLRTTHLFGYLTFAVMLTQGNRLFLRVWTAEAVQRQRLEQRNRELHEQAHSDALTGLYNYRLLEALLPQLVAQAVRHKEPLSVCMIDLHDFKGVNDRFGHDVGNVVLRFVAATLRQTVRRGDVVFRVGGDEFLVVLPNTQAEAARQVAERIREPLSHTPAGWQSNGLPPVRCSIGIAELSDQAPYAAELLRRADRALYAAKDRGGGATEVGDGDGHPADSRQPAQ